MDKFSVREGLELLPAVQIDGINERLKNSLWSLFDCYLYQRGYQTNRALHRNASEYTIDEKFESFSVVFWELFLRKPIDELRLDNSYYKCQKFKDSFFEMIWFNIYNFIEYFLTSTRFSHGERDFFIDAINQVMIEEFSGYRLIDSKIVPIIDKQEIATVEAVLSLPEQYHGVKNHIKKSLEQLSKKPAPDCKNSIKEAVSSLESLFRILFSKNKDLDGKTLSAILKETDRFGGCFHPAFLKTISSVYEYASDAGGIRHADKVGELKYKTELSDATFVLIFCSSLISLVIQKSKN